MKTYLALGSNKEDRYINLQKGLKALNNYPHIWIINKSYIYESSPMYFLDQEDYYNMVVEIETNLNPLQLLDIVKDIEVQCGRKNNKTINMPRELDIDILAMEDLLIRSNILNIPHLAIKERMFVLKPWSDIAPKFIISNENKTVEQLLTETNDKSDIRMILEIEGDD